MSAPGAVQLKPQRRNRRTHPWIFASEVARFPSLEQVADGSMVDVLDAQGRFCGRGFLNRQSQIAVRYLERGADVVIDRAWWIERFGKALEHRHRFLGPQVKTFRWIHGEADGLPGLTVDRYGDFVVVQLLALGLEPWREVIVECLAELGSPLGIFERSDAPVRRLEGLKERVGCLWGEPPPTLVEIEEGSARLLVDIQQGQKTGLFLDQRFNRQHAARFAEGRSVLNAFGYTGAFGVHCALAGASSVLNVDIAEAATAIAEQNAQLNGVGEQCRALTANAFDVLREFDREGRRFEMIILDPPAFAKSRSVLEGALRGYKEINLRAMKLLTPGGILVTCSCSSHLSMEMFRDVIRDAAQDTGRTACLVEQRGQAPDHPILLHIPETEYLKYLLISID
ncbi:class I SAM-dependent rRNA methyltransferase [Gloeobacter morelensis]|uniref:class I SAM-dependent rRNA methyltransferase n=1 Tax=Gloeobacter morelensis TaxID=2907343 RepID=UPI001E608008|nr:class I SAM-dependent rRNA methyltransferase [Gloeobacter morelensis]